jgi:hypothetical protein
MKSLSAAIYFSIFFNFCLILYASYAVLHYNSSITATETNELRANANPLPSIAVATSIILFLTAILATVQGQNISNGFFTVFFALIVTILMYLFCILFGAKYSPENHLYNYQANSFVNNNVLIFAYYFVVMNIAPIVLLLDDGLQSSFLPQIQLLFKRLITENKVENVDQVLLQTTLITAAMSVWLSCYILVLDWDKLWQYFPYTALLANNIGYLLALFIAAVRIYTEKRKIHLT